MEAYTYLGQILDVDPVRLEKLDTAMAERTSESGVMESLMHENRKRVDETLGVLDSRHKPSHEVYEVLRRTILDHEKRLAAYVDTFEGKTEFDRAAAFARKAATAKKGFFLKKRHAEDILRKREPKNVLKFLGAKSVSEVLAKHDVTEVFSSLRFLESQKWMHETFDEVYSRFTPKDFEERDIEVRVLGPEWQEVAKQFVVKKHHNVSHLKEFGVIFLNPVKTNIPGKFLRDTALFLHYFHEIEFYSKLFKRYAEEEHDHFAEKLKMLLRGDVPEKKTVKEGEWLIVQRYLWKEDPKDLRLALPRVNPESMHWARGERDLTECCKAHGGPNLDLWHNLDWVAGVFEKENGNDREPIISFDLEDNAMGLVSFIEGEGEVFTYHQREAMWTKLFEKYVGGEEEMERLLLEHFDKGVIQFT